MRTLEEHKLYAKLKKFEFWLNKVHFLGHVVTKDGILVDPARVEAIVNWPRLATVTEVWHFMGMAGYYRICVEGFSKLAFIITRLICKNTKIE